MRKALVLGSVAAMAVGLTLSAAPANAIGAGDTLVTFTVGVTGSTVSLVPGVYVPGTGSATMADGTITSVVTDLRPSAGTWTDNVSSTDYSLVGATTPSGTALIPAASAQLTTAAVVTIPGTATITNTHSSSGTPLTLSNSSAALLSAATSNVNTTTLTHSLAITTTGKATGLYTGTITQTIS